MADTSWWTKITAVELLDLRRRLLGQIESQFRSSLGNELEDVVQQAFLSLFRRRASIDIADDGLLRYLVRVARNAALDKVNTSKRRQGKLPDVATNIAQLASQTTSKGGISPVTSEEKEKIWQIFCALDEVERLVLWNHLVDEKSIRAIAQDLNLNWHRVAAIIENSIRRFRLELGE